MGEGANKIRDEKMHPDMEARKGAGRPKGSPNKTTSLLKDAILMAATTADKDGLVGYLKTQALQNPGPFMSLLGKVLPMQITGEDGGAVRIERIERVVVDA